MSTPPDAISSGFAALVEGLRQDVREDLAAMENRVTAAVTTLREEVHDDLAALDGKVDSYFVEHGEEHEQDKVERREIHGRFFEFIRQAELADARRDGALGLVRFGFELVNRYRAAIISIILAFATAALALSGRITIGIQ